MDSSDEGQSRSPLLQKLSSKSFVFARNDYGLSGPVIAVIVGVLVPLLTSIAMIRKKTKQRGTQVFNAGGEPGFAVRNARFDSLLEFPWEGATTMASLFEQSCKKHAKERFLGSRILISRENVTSGDGKVFEKLHLGEYVWQTYREVFDRVCNFASGLVRFGHDTETRVAIFAETRAEWIIAFQGCFRQNITVVTIYSSLGEDALVHSLNETEVSTLICDSRQLKKLASIGHNLHAMKNVIYFEDVGTVSDSSCLDGLHWRVSSFSEIESLGEECSSIAVFPASEDVAVIMYTSGSTGQPKGVMMTHGNIVATAAAVRTVVPKLGRGDVYLAYLPLAHIFELAAEVVILSSGCAIGYGSPLTLTDSSNKIKRGTQGDVTVLKPSLLTAVPAILDRIRDGVRRKVDERGGMAKRLFDIGYKRRLTAIEGSWLGAWGPEKMLWDMLVFQKIRSFLGGRIRFILCGGAPLSGDAQRFINICMGAPIGQGYGLTETCAGATFSEWDDYSVGRVGPPLPCCLIKLVSWEEGGYMTHDKPMPRGEVVIGGFSVTKGYYKNKEKTGEVYKVDEKGMRWFYSGDIGQVHPDGCLEIIDRKKDIVKLQHGEYISLGKVEAALILNNYVENIMLYADPLHDHCVALVVPSHQAIETWARNSNIQYRDIADLCQKEECVHEVQRSILKEAKAAKLDKFEIPSKIMLLPDPWTPETGLVTAALKLKRESLKSKFKEELGRLYD